jgi:hypothetical protein
VLERAPKNWDQLNLEADIEANVIEGQPLDRRRLLLWRRGKTFPYRKNLYHTSLTTGPRTVFIELQIRHLCLPLHCLMHDAAYKNNRLRLILVR